MATSLILWHLLAYLSVVELALARGKIINIFNGEGNDVLQSDGIRVPADDEKLRSAIFNNSQSKWDLKDTNGRIVIPYVISGKYDDIELSIIKKAMKRIRRNTCVRFRKRKSEVDYVDIQNEKDKGCYTQGIGRRPGQNILMLQADASGTCLTVQIVQHELLHVVGLWHEHNRFDRDNYVKIRYKNILPGEEKQFDITPSTDSTMYAIPYDYKSLMHYGKTVFARPGKTTMETLDPKYADVIGTRTRASPRDYQKVCRIYGCKMCNRRPKRIVCSDKRPTSCAAMKQLGTLDCRYNYALDFCCATCNAATP